MILHNHELALVNVTTTTAAVASVIFEVFSFKFQPLTLTVEFCGKSRKKSKVLILECSWHCRFYKTINLKTNGFKNKIKNIENWKQIKPYTHKINQRPVWAFFFFFFCLVCPSADTTPSVVGMFLQALPVSERRFAVNKVHGLAKQTVQNLMRVTATGTLQRRTLILQWDEVLKLSGQILDGLP